ncbi:thymidylate kinase [Luminiphilus syltensis NOR5-1B]|uniref:Thymidylate kinase n=1 Tax=Luminiphilus syltensis NOR5-1B TaxID=565045 RepID=B8KQW6_9GAMM|nr:dTMP kinase [Luminiphilus syltensis]EED36363.1 thymidylate kinase [Luminiphilus syltensis NOR5-1B]
MKPGQFLTVEGGEGVGKSTNLDFIAKTLRAQGIDLVVTREPGGTPLAEALRALLISDSEDPPCPNAELLMIFAARAQHLSTVIEPALKAGRWVLCDRFTDATFAYQGAGRGIEWSSIETLENLIQGDRRPDLTLLLDMEPAIGMDRAGSRGALDRFEREALPFFDRVRRGYKTRAAQAPHRYRVIDASQSIDAVQRDIARVLAELFNG